MTKHTYQLGRSAACDICVDDSKVSAVHANITIVSDGRLFVADLESSNGTFEVVGNERKSIRQGFVSAGSRLAFGTNFEITVAELTTRLRKMKVSRTPSVDVVDKGRRVICKVCGNRKLENLPCDNCDPA